MMGTLARSSLCSDHRLVSAHSHPRELAPPRRLWAAMCAALAAAASPVASVAGSPTARGFLVAAGWPLFLLRLVIAWNAARILARPLGWALALGWSRVPRKAGKR